MADPMLFTATALGAIPIANRIVMAPMTRNRAEADGRPSPMMTTYYAQRASAGLIVSEMTQIASTGVSYANTPGIETAEQVALWREITDAVHAEGGRIVLQIAHGGRISHPTLLGGATPVAPSAIRPAGETWTPLGLVPFETPRELTADEIMGLVRQFRVAAANARDAGFDGIELHAANGYLLDQFLRSGSNQRSDQWGGSVANRARFLIDVIEATIAEWGPGRVGVRLSPFNPYNAMHDDAPFTTFPDVAALLDTLPLAYLHVNSRTSPPGFRRKNLGGGISAKSSCSMKISRENGTSRVPSAGSSGWLAAGTVPVWPSGRLVMTTFNGRSTPSRRWARVLRSSRMACSSTATSVRALYFVTPTWIANCRSAAAVTPRRRRPEIVGMRGSSQPLTVPSVTSCMSLRLLISV